MFEARHARRWREMYRRIGAFLRASERASEVPAVAGTRMWPRPRHTWAGREFRNSRQSESTEYWFGSFNLCPGHHRRAVFDFYGSPLSREERDDRSSTPPPFSLSNCSRSDYDICLYFIIWRIERNLENYNMDWILLVWRNGEERDDRSSTPPPFSLSNCSRSDYDICLYFIIWRIERNLENYRLDLVIWSLEEWRGARRPFLDASSLSLSNCSIMSRRVIMICSYFIIWRIERNLENYRLDFI